MAQQDRPACKNIGSAASGACDHNARIFFLQYLNALAALQRWNEIKELLISERFPIDPCSNTCTWPWRRRTGFSNWRNERMATRFGSREHLREIVGSRQIRRAKLCQRYRRCRLLGSDKNRAEKSRGVRRPVAPRPGSRTYGSSANDRGGNHSAWPDDAAARNQDDYLRLLLGASDGAAEAAEREAQVLVRTEPRNWSARATLGLARLRLGRNKDALAAIRELRVTGKEPPGALAVRAAILAANGYEEGARNDAHLLGAKPLLARRTRAHRSAIAIDYGLIFTDCHSERSEESQIISSVFHGRS